MPICLLLFRRASPPKANISVDCGKFEADSNPCSDLVDQYEMVEQADAAATEVV